ncbi:hemicentin-1 isoform X1 [Schistocerca nitens]|uniref:hemicentin-1 isoform X1 n=1 Tax=Schistocerca nitens TaxID=7011 RepID=UPI002118EA5F|nr:hemicentin-1 isoform X1 [Schistocerca nitens]
MLRNGTELPDGREIGPYTEGDELTLVCESGGGKPIPAVSWWNGTQRIPATNEQRAGSNGAGTGVATLTARLGRGDLRATYQCRAHNDALKEPLTASLRLLVHVRPLELQLTGVKEHVVQGTNVAAVCQAVGANPEATITWYNGTDRINNTAGNVVEQQDDGTFTTRNTLIFQATLYENERTLHCEASNPVMAQRGDKPMRKSVKLEVLYPPIVTVKPDNITVNESSDITLECEYVANPTTLLAVRWYRDKQLVVLNADHYEGGTTDQTTLLIKNATRFDQGVYECGLENDVGAENSTNSVNVSVYFKPVVRLSMEPETPVSEVSRLNITLLCEVLAGNPATLTAVRWYLDGELLKQLPDCNGTDDAAATFCDVDPSRLMLEDVGRGFHANYSCEGMNDAGWGPTSPDRELVVFYPPGPATLVYEPSRVVKKGTVTLTCSVEDPGRPETTKFRWIRGSHNISAVTSANWTIDPVSLETESNFTCLAYNEGGEGEPATVFIEVLAPPAFINTSPPYYGAAVNTQNLNISCRVECSPICEVNWLKNNVLIDTSNGSASPYTVINKRLPADTAANDFQSILSTLLWNMDAWPGKQFDILHDSANYTCLSTSNSVGPGVNSTTVFRVEYPPGNITVSNKVVYVTEGHVPEKVLCNAKAYPEASYQWWKEGEKEPIVKGKTLMLNFAVHRRNSGNYICEASNRHGNTTQKTTINVLYKPECAITQAEMDGKLVLTCSTSANPPEVDFTWRIKNENDTIEENVEKKGQSSILTLESYVENFRTYLCFANNSVGVGIPCERDVTGHAVTWWGRFESDHIIVIIAVIVGAILMVIIVCVIIIIICRRKRADDKYNNPVELEERENPDGNASVTPSQNPARPVHKWPLRPGVLVHVNGSHSLNFGRLHQTTHDSAASSNTPNYNLPYSSNTMPKNLAARKERTKKCTRKLKQRRAVSLSSLRHDDTNQHSRANKIRQMFVNDGTKYHCDTLPGIFHGKSGVVTFKKLEGPINYSVSRKRKKPGSGPNPSATKDKSKPDLTSSLGDGLLQPDGDKAFYENLPFHGMQSAPNKLAASSSNANSTSRPTSQLSHCGSSGYGSTRSHVGPHFKKNGSDSFLPDKKYHSFREQARGIRRTSQKLVPKFYSLRMYKRDKQRLKEDKKKIMMDVLKKDTASHTVENQQQETNLDSSCRSDEIKNKTVPPTPAPRRQISSKLVKHTYQNVPIPIKPNSLELTAQPKSQVHQHHHHHHHHYNLTSHHLLINPTNTTTDITRQQQLQQQQQQPQPRQQNELQHVYGSNSAKRNNRTYLPPLRLEYQQPYYVTDPFTTNSIVYADLSLSANGIQQETHFLQSNRPPQNSTEYAVLKFHDVGQEIDV